MKSGGESKDRRVRCLGPASMAPSRSPEKAATVGDVRSLEGIAAIPRKVVVLPPRTTKPDSQPGFARIAPCRETATGACPIQPSNVITMANRAPNPNPESLSAIWKFAHELEKDIAGLRTAINKPSFWSRLRAKFWAERSWSILLALTLITAIGSGACYVVVLIADRYIQSALTASVGPIQKDIQRIDGDTQQIKGILSVLQAQIATQKYSSIPPEKLKEHREELKDLKNKLASTNKDSPNFWPVSFQVINLLSKALSYIENPNPTESVVEDTEGTFIEKNGSVVLLKGLIRNSQFKDSVIRFDPSVRLVNVTFKNCVFVFPLAEPNPPKPLQQIGSILLAASDLTKVTINAS